MNSQGDSDSQQFRYADRPLLGIHDLVPATARRLLDVGCGTAAFGSAIKQRRPELEVWGLDPDPAVATIASQRVDRFLPQPFEEDPALHQYFDCITFLDSLEHFVDPWAVMRTARTMLCPGGSIVASIPNTRHHSVVRSLLIHGEWRYADAGLLDRTHLRFFTRRSAVTALLEAGFDDVVVRMASRRGRGLVRLARLAGRHGDELLCTHIQIAARSSD